MVKKKNLETSQYKQFIAMILEAWPDPIFSRLQENNMELWLE